MRPEVFAAMAETDAVCNHLHFPLQSGSDRILAAMHRGYNAARYLEKVRVARATIPDLAITSDIIVGFPGETDDDFERTLEVAAEVGYDSCYPFIFSPRTGTEAATMTDRFIAEDVIADRFERLKIVLDRSAHQRHEARVGMIESVLVEGPSKRDDTRWSGRTTQNKLVHFPRTFGVATGGYADVRITHAGKHHLLGELVAVTAAPRHKTRIPVAAI
jgi:tRNA-2-methylthio-N6-dimethylallyladenosine synthase